MQPLARMGPDPTTGTCKHDHEPTRTDHGPIRPDPAVDRGGHPPAMGPPAIQTSRTVVTTGRAEWPSTDIGVLSVGPPLRKLLIDRSRKLNNRPKQKKRNQEKHGTKHKVKKSQNMFKKGQNESMWEGDGVESKWAYQFSHVSYKC